MATPISSPSATPRQASGTLPRQGASGAPPATSFAAQAERANQTKTAAPVIPAATTPAVVVPLADAPAEKPTAEKNWNLIQHRAYSIWEIAGRPDGQAVAHWLQAEKEIEKLQA